MATRKAHSRPELVAPADVFYDNREARKYTTNSHMIKTQHQLTERALELLALPKDAPPQLLLDLGCGSALSGSVLASYGHHWVGMDLSEAMLRVAVDRGVTGVQSADRQAPVDTNPTGVGVAAPVLFDEDDEDDDDDDEDGDDDDEPGTGDVMVGDLGQGLPLRTSLRLVHGSGSLSRHAGAPVTVSARGGETAAGGVFDGAISISAVQWLCNADSSGAVPRLRLRRFFATLYAALKRGARAVLQIYPDSPQQAEMITSAAMKAGFSGGLVVDYPNSTRAKKYFLTLCAGPPSTSTAVPQGRDGDPDDGGDGEMVRSAKRRKVAGAGAGGGGSVRHPQRKGGADWIRKKKEQRMMRGYTDIPRDSKYTGRKRKSGRF